MLLRLLTLMFSEVTTAMTTRIHAITDEVALTMFAAQILTIKRLEDLLLPDDEAMTG